LPLLQAINFKTAMESPGFQSRIQAGLPGSESGGAASPDRIRSIWALRPAE
jgi:hypothetical protein